jgi:hypothetical protein
MKGSTMKISFNKITKSRCEACGGDGEKIKTMYDCDRCKECLIQEVAGVCPKDELIICPTCKGKFSKHK